MDALDALDRLSANVAFSEDHELFTHLSQAVGAKSMWDAARSTPEGLALLKLAIMLAEPDVQSALVEARQKMDALTVEVTNARNH